MVIKMKKRIKAIAITAALLMGLLSPAFSASATQDYVWKLVDVVDYENKDGWAQANLNEVYHNDVFYSRGNYSVKTIYTGQSQGTRVKGEAVKLNAEFSTPPEIISSDSQVSLSFTLSASENTLSFYTFSATFSADFYFDPNIEPIMGRGTTFKNTEGSDSFTIGGTSYATVGETITAKPNPGKNQGDKMVLRVKFYRGVLISTYYIYEWLPVSSAVPVAPPQRKGFTDMPSGHWAHDNVMEMVELGILDGYEDGSFKPNNIITRAEFAKIMVLSLNLNTSSPARPTFSDVPTSHWGYQVIESAREYLTGYRNSSTGALTFEPSSAAVREDVAVAIVKAKGMGSASANLALLDRFADSGRISQALRNHVAIAVEQGYMQGSNIGFEPQKALTRAEACALLSRLIDRSQFQGEKEKIAF